MSEYEGIVKMLDHVKGYDLLIGGHNGYEFYYPRLVDGKVYVRNGRDGEKIGKVVDEDDPRLIQLVQLIRDKYSTEERRFALSEDEFIELLKQVGFIQNVEKDISAYLDRFQVKGGLFSPEEVIWQTQKSKGTIRVWAKCHPRVVKY